MIGRFFWRLSIGQLAKPSRLFAGRMGNLWNRRNAALNDLALERSALRTDDRVLEIGCGGGYLLGRMAESVKEGKLAGADISPAMIRFCGKRHEDLVREGRLDLRCAPAESLPFADGEFTVVCSVNSLFYWKDAARAFSEIFRVLKSGGRFVLCLTAKAFIEQRFGTGSDLRTYEPAEVVRLMADAGFEHMEVQSRSDAHREFFCVTSEKI